MSIPVFIFPHNRLRHRQWLQKPCHLNIRSLAPAYLIAGGDARFHYLSLGQGEGFRVQKIHVEFALKVVKILTAAFNRPVIDHGKCLFLGLEPTRAHLDLVLFDGHATRVRHLPGEHEATLLLIRF